MDQLSSNLKCLLSPEAGISSEGPPRWSTYNAPRPNLVVNVATEADVVAVVKYCAEHDIPFLAQNGGIGWASSNLTSGVLINIAPLDTISFSDDKTEVTVGGGVSIKQAIDAANKAGVLMFTGNCNCVGALGGILGGGFGNLLGKYGFGVDNVLSLKLVTASGELIHVTPKSHPDLFWATRGAAPNFGIVTSATLKSHPTADRTAWSTVLMFTTDKLQEVVQAVEELRPKLLPEQTVFFYLGNSGPPNNQPVVIVTGFLFHGTPEKGKELYSGLYALEPVFEQSGVLPYDQWNTGGDPFCTRGGRKPAHAVGLRKLHPEHWTDILQVYADFHGKPGAENSIILVELYNFDKARELPKDSSAFPHRDININIAIIPWYSDQSLDEQAITFAKKVKAILESKEKTQAAYINFAHGDEGLDAIYGDSLPRLKEIKKHWDPKNRFNQWFNIQ